MTHTKKDAKMNARRRMRIRTVMDEWLRNPKLLAIPALVLALSVMADVVAGFGMYATASSFALLGHAGILALVALLAVGVVRL